MNLPNSTTSNTLNADLGVKSQIDKKAKWLWEKEPVQDPLINIMVNTVTGNTNVLDNTIVGLPVVSRSVVRFSTQYDHSAPSVSNTSEHSNDAISNVSDAISNSSISSIRF